MDQSNPPKSGLPIPAYNPFERRWLPDADARLSDYGETFGKEPVPALELGLEQMLPPEPLPSLKGAKPKDGDIHRVILRREPRFRDTVKGKLVGIAVGSSLASCAAVPVSHFLSQPSPVATAAAANDVPPDSAEAEHLAKLSAAFERVQAGDARGTVVLDLGHGDYKNEKNGEIVTVKDPGALTHVKNGRDTVVVKESDIAEAMGARIALQLIARGHNVKFTRHIDLEHNPHLTELRPTERAILKRINSTVEVLPNRFDQRIETARAELKDGKPVMYLVLHADKAPNEARRGAAFSIHPRSSTDSAAYRLSKTLQEHFRHTQNGSLAFNATKGVIPGQEGFGALFAEDCQPEIGLGTRKVAIISPTPTGTTFSKVRNGLGDIPYSLVEMGNLSNSADTWRLRDQKWGSNFARVTAEGVDQFFAREYEGAKAPPKPTTITVNGKAVKVVPENEKAGAAMLNGMAYDTPPDFALRTRTVDRCEPTGNKYKVRVADYVPMKPKTAPKPEASPTAPTAKAEPKPASHVAAQAERRGKPEPRSRS